MDLCKTPDRIWKDGDDARQTYAKIGGKYENLINLDMKVETELN